jgi:hypothetical protein
MGWLVNPAWRRQAPIEPLEVRSQHRHSKLRTRRTDHAPSSMRRTLTRDLHQRAVEALCRDSSVLGGLGFIEIVDHYDRIIRVLTSRRRSSAFLFGASDEPINPTSDS